MFDRLNRICNDLEHEKTEEDDRYQIGQDIRLIKCDLGHDALTKSTITMTKGRLGY